MGEAELKTRGRLDPLMDALERELRRGEVDPALLEDLGWTAAQARQFVESYRHVKRGGQKQTEHTDLPTQTETTDMGGSRNGPLLRGGRAGDTDARSMRATHERAPDATRELLEIGRQRVTPRYRSILHGYYRSLGTRPAADGSS